MTIRQATLEDTRQVQQLLASAEIIHTHLDWRSPLEWLGQQPILVNDDGEKLNAILSAPVEIPFIHWIRLFCSIELKDYPTHWHDLLEAMECNHLEVNSILCCVGITPWMSILAEDSGFSRVYEIVTLRWVEQTNLHTHPITKGIYLRPMLEEDLPNVANVDHLAFDPLWRHDLAGLTLAYEQSQLATVAELGEQIIGYQITTMHEKSAHLARLAVLPELQHQGVGKLLLNEVFQKFSLQSKITLTVNTQSSNLESLRLYKNSGFRLTGESYPVWIK
jgi:ribosomal protein S18 acetylase RimI-like enzyme